MDNASKEVSFVAHSEMVKEREDHQQVVLFTKYHMDSDKPVTVANLPPVRFIGGPTRQGRRGIIQVSWYPETSVAAIATVGIPVEEDLADIGIKTRNGVIHMGVVVRHPG